MLRFAIPVLFLLLAACAEAPLEAERESENAAMAERVREANDAGRPLIELEPEPIGYPEMEANDMFGPACAYAPGVSMAARVIARESDAWMKIDDELVRFAADPGSRELPAKTRTRYNGLEYSLRLEIEETVAAEETEDTTYNGTIWLYDRWDRVVYTGSGTANCGD